MKSQKGGLTHTPFKKIKKELEKLSLPTVKSSVPFTPLREEEREEDRGESGSSLF
ncbi:MAG: hypothetical protein JXO48_08080 [Deltaproteobacteria bacterium]|nr:hypothetical protein [Deltaproteobacteria bacterium]